MRPFVTGMALLVFMSASLVEAADAPADKAVKLKEYVITLKGDAFSPPDLIIPADEKIEITVKNTTGTAAEFESDDIDREKVVAANSDIKLTVGPLKKGTYSYVNDYHEASKGTITAK